jgi:MFS family permease
MTARLAGLAGRGGLRALRHRNFRLYWGGQAVSLIGTHMQRAAQAWLVLTLTSDPLMLGLLVTAQFGPVLALGLFGGIVADSLPKRTTIMVTQSVAMVLAFALGVLAATGTAEVWHVLLMAFLLGVTSVVDIPTRQTFVIEMVGRDDVVSAVALNSALVNAAKVIGPAIAGLTIGAFSVAVAFFINGFSFVAVIGGLLAMRASELNPVARAALPRTIGAVAGNLGEGLRYIARTRDVLLALSIVGTVSTAAMNYQVLIPPLARDVLGTGAIGFGFLMAASGLGSITAALAVASLGRPRTIAIVVAALALGLFEIALGASRLMALSLVCMAGVGLAGVVMTTNANTLIQTLAPDRLRGRVIAVYVTVFVGSTPIGGLLFGGIAGAFGTATALLAGGAIATVVGAGALLVGWRSGSFALSADRLDEARAAADPVDTLA